MRFILYENYIRKIGTKIKVVYIRESFITEYVISEVEGIMYYIYMYVLAMFSLNFCNYQNGYIYMKAVPVLCPHICVHPVDGM